MKVKVGSDPEYFLIKDGSIISAVGIVGGTKDKPEVLNEYCSVHEDNVAVECSVMPAETSQDLVDHITISINSVKKKLGIGYDLSEKASHKFDPKELDSDGAREAGCSADYDAMTNEENEAPDLSDTTLRACGGHVHVSYDDPNEEYNRAIVRMLDVFLGVPSVILDSDHERRAIYGKASAYREKKYGLEYRTLSNFWTMDENYIKWVFDTVIRVTNMVVDSQGEINEGIANRAREIINNSLVGEAKLFTDLYKIEFPK